MPIYPHLLLLLLATSPVNWLKLCPETPLRNDASPPPAPPPSPFSEELIHLGFLSISFARTGGQKSSHHASKARQHCGTLALFFVEGSGFRISSLRLRGEGLSSLSLSVSPNAGSLEFQKSTYKREIPHARVQTTPVVSMSWICASERAWRACCN